MCLTTEMLAAFLNLLPAGIVTTEPDRVTIHAEKGDAIWIAKGDVWCVDGPDDVALDG
jgi:hypothetical protein